MSEPTSSVTPTRSPSVRQDTDGNNDATARVSKSPPVPPSQQIPSDHSGTAIDILGPVQRPGPLGPAPPVENQVQSSQARHLPGTQPLPPSAVYHSNAFTGPPLQHSQQQHSQQQYPQQQYLQQHHPQAPQIIPDPRWPYYVQPPGYPMLMNMCPHCGFRAGQLTPVSVFPQPVAQRPPQYSKPPERRPLRMPLQPQPQLPTSQPQIQHSQARSLHPTSQHTQPDERAPLPVDRPDAHPDGTTSPATGSPSPSTNQTMNTSVPVPPPGSERAPEGPPRQPGPGDEVIIQPDGTSKRIVTRRPFRKRLTRDERRDVLLMRRLGHTYEAIAKFLGTTSSAVSYTCKQGTADVFHQNAGRKVKFPPEKLTEMIAYVEKYLASERAAGIDRKTGKKKVQPLTYNMIRDKIFRDENGEISRDFSVSDKWVKLVLNRHGLWLRQPTNRSQIEQARVRAKQRWSNKLEEKRLAAQAAVASGQPMPEGEGQSESNVSADGGAGLDDTMHGYAEVDVGDEEVDMEDEEMDDGVYSESESIPDHTEDMEAQLRRALDISPISNG